ncbi:zinc-finger of the MIZ type in Nse subunit-domain-containing protein [Hypoxylon sp. FL1284]|nr:zinc-finger of the MIZ type in Nse subunit-domain-containing protein [Hypoxylon sp. FL1284]
MPLLSGSRRLQSAAERNRGRPSATSSSHSQSQRRDEPAELPEYEPPTFPLDAERRRALSQLSSSKDARKYEQQLDKSIELLSASVSGLNDRLSERREALQKYREKRGQDGDKSDQERAQEKAVLMLERTVPQLTDECDHAVRGVVDLKMELDDSRKAFKDMERQIEVELARAAQRRSDRADDDDDMPDANIPAVTGPLQLLKEAKEKAAADYAAMGLYQKYGLNNDYIGFKRLWHDSIERDGKPLPDASRWFTENGGRDEADDDEDLIIAEEHVDIRCPLSMGVMQDPYTSRKCKHTFEKSSIVEFLRSQRGGRARCPQTGCREEITISDFQPDHVMLRRIKRRLAAQQASMADDEDDDTGLDGDSDVKMTPD